MVRNATAVWNGDFKSGGGVLSGASGALKDAPYTFASRFEGQAGLTPEDLIAAAHAGCFSMALTVGLVKAGLKPERVETTAEVTLEPVDGKPTVTRSALRTTARVPGVDRARFMELANDAKAGCPISRLLKTEITLEATLEG
jgi:osmotically inducible protein OsmC